MQRFDLNPVDNHNDYSTPNPFEIFTWSCSPNTNVSTGFAVGSGLDNTTQIALGEPNCRTSAGFWAYYSGHVGAVDWYLPSADELYLIYQNKDSLGRDFPALQGEPVTYWSSTQSGSSEAVYTDFSTGAMLTAPKLRKMNAIAIREF